VYLLTYAAEHAYYLKHTNRRASYLANMLHIINVRLFMPYFDQLLSAHSFDVELQWGQVELLFQTALKELPKSDFDEHFGYLQTASEQL
jgi:hypothetical protein